MRSWNLSNSIHGAAVCGKEINRNLSSMRGYRVLPCSIGYSMFGATSSIPWKNETLTDRTEIWHDVLQIRINPILGAGFESFWLGDRLKVMWEKWPYHPNQAHNGYLETYLNLGLVGLFLLVALFIATFWKMRSELFTNFQFGRFRMGFLLAIIAYNWTEAAFKNISVIWFVFCLIALDYSQPESDSFGQAKTIVPDEIEGLVHSGEPGYYPHG